MAMNEAQYKYVHELARLLRNDIYAAKTGDRYLPIREKLTDLVVERHIQNIQPVGAYPLRGEKTQIGVLDFDDHDGSVGWVALTQIVAQVIVICLAAGLRPHVFRSGGGKGIHLWFHWNSPQTARYVRHLLRGLLAAAGLSDGAGGVTKGQVEVFPRQDRADPPQLGNLIALPGARDSVPLDVDSLAPLAWDAVDVIERMMLESADPPEVAGEERAPGTFVMLLGDDAEARSALTLVPSDDYYTWIRVGLALKSAFGDPAFPIFDEWSATCAAKYPRAGAIQKVWDGLRPNGDVGLGTIFYLAKRKGWNGPSDPMVREMNARFGILTHGRATEIIVKNGDRLPGDGFVTLAKPVFLDRMAPEFFDRLRPDGTTVRASKAKAWLQHPQAAHYARVVFDPSLPPGHNGRTWNTWTGFGVEAAPGDWSLLKQHILANICQGDQLKADWFLNWMALGIQRPGRVIGTAPVLIGRPGTGKGVLAHAYGRLWGEHYIPLTQADQITGRFSGHLMGRRFVFIDEGTFGGNRKDAGVLKTRITEATLTFERKGLDPIVMPNRLIFMVASNEASVVPADTGDRRWMMFEVGDQHREDHAYFKAIDDQLRAGGYEAMLYELQIRDFEVGPDPRIIIKGEALFEQIILAQVLSSATCT